MARMQESLRAGATEPCFVLCYERAVLCAPVTGSSSMPAQGAKKRTSSSGSPCPPAAPIYDLNHLVYKSVLISVLTVRRACTLEMHSSTSSV